MPWFEIEQYELHITVHHVETDSRARAIDRLLNHPGEDNEPIQTEFSEMDRSRGMIVGELFAAELRQLGVKLGPKHLVESIRSIRELTTAEELRTAGVPHV